MNKIAPQDVRQHLMLNQSRLSTAEERLPRKLKLTWMQPRNFRVMIWVKLDSPVGNGPVKGGKPHELPYCHTILERVARRAKEKCTKDSDSNLAW